MQRNGAADRSVRCSTLAGSMFQARCLSQFGAMGAQPIDRCFDRHRAGNREPLHMRAAELRENGVFAKRLDPFGECLEAEVLGHRQYSGDHALLRLVRIDTSDVGAVDLDPVDREAADGKERGVTSAKIVKIDPAAEFRQRVDVAHDDVVVAFGDHGFEDFDGQPLWGEVEPVEFPLQLCDQSYLAH